MMDSVLVISSTIAACVSLVSLILNVAILVRLSGLKRGSGPATIAAPPRTSENQLFRRPQGPQHDERRNDRPQQQGQQPRPPRPSQPPAAAYDSLRDINLRLKNAERFQERARQEAREATAEVTGDQNRQPGNGRQPGSNNQGGGFRHDRDRRRRRGGGRYRSHDGRPPYRQESPAPHGQTTMSVSVPSSQTTPPGIGKPDSSPRVEQHHQSSDGGKPETGNEPVRDLATQSAASATVSPVAPVQEPTQNAVNRPAEPNSSSAPVSGTSLVSTPTTPTFGRR